jgi:hypothetical protein
VRVTGKAQLGVLVEPVSLEAAGVGGGEGAEGAGVRHALVLAHDVLAQLRGIARLVRTARTPVAHLIIALKNTGIKQATGSVTLLIGT